MDLDDQDMIPYKVATQPEREVVKTTTFECGCVASWKVKRLTATPMVCPVHRAIWVRTESEPA